jgi:hypothetical protein
VSRRLRLALLGLLLAGCASTRPAEVSLPARLCNLDSLRWHSGFVPMQWAPEHCLDVQHVRLAND